MASSATLSRGASAVLTRRAILAGGIASACGSRQRTRLWFGGDVHFGMRCSGRLAALPALVDAAAGVVNLEGPIARAAPDASGRTLSNCAAAPSELKRAGVRVVGVANNHRDDFGPAGRTRTLAGLTDAGLVPSGDVERHVPIAYVGGRRVALTSHHLASTNQPSNLRRRLASARRQAQVLVCAFHVDGPPSYLPKRELRGAVEAALAAGARVVVAHGTHAVGPVERRGNSVIAWGLGNLLFDCPCTREVDGLLLKVEIDESTTNAAVIPIDAGLDGAPVRPATDASLTVQLLRSIGSSSLTESGRGASF